MARLDKAAYQAALARIVKLVQLDPAPETVDGCELAGLTALAEEYEKEHFPFGAPTDAEMAAFIRAERGE